MEEVYQRWTALCDAAWRRKYHSQVVLLAVICSAGAVVGLGLLCLVMYQAIQNFQVSGGVPNTPAMSNQYYLAVWLSYAGLAALPLGMVYSTLRARLSALPVEFGTALAPAQAFALELRAIRRALYLTVLTVALVPETVQGVTHITTQWIGLWYMDTLGSCHNPVYIGSSFAWDLLARLGAGLCLVEWQVILLSRFPPRASLIWLQAMPYALPLAAGAAVSGIGMLSLRLHGGIRTVSHAWNIIPRYDIIAITLVLMLLGLALAPQFWRWAAAARTSWRWAVVALCCLVALSIPWSRNFYNPGLAPSQAHRMATTLARSLYLGCGQPPFSATGILEENPLDYDLRAQGIITKYMVKYRTVGPGVVVAENIYLPWYLALLALVAYYAYSYLALRRAAQVMPAGEDELAQRQ